MSKSRLRSAFTCSFKLGLKLRHRLRLRFRLRHVHGVRKKDRRRKNMNGGRVSDLEREQGKKHAEAQALE